MGGEGWIIRRYETVDSTQHEAARLFDAGAVHRTVVVADHQTAGYGRKGDPWHDTPGHALLATLILRPDHSAAVAVYPMALALSAIAAINATTGLRAAIKWPNDLIVGERKVAGLLGSARWEGARLVALLLGIGINVRGGPETFASRGLMGATSLEAESGRACDPLDILDAVLAAFDAHAVALREGDTAHVSRQWRSAVSTVGRAVVVTLRDGRLWDARAQDVTDDGDLIVRLPNGDTHMVRAGAVAALRHTDGDGSHSLTGS